MKQDKQDIRVTLRGIRPIMFDRYAGDNKTQLPPEQKLYFAADGESLVLPSTNIMSFLSAENTTSAPKISYDPRKYKAVCQALRGFVTIEPWLIPILRDGEPIRFQGFGQNGITLHRSVARLAKGVPNPKERPLVDMPWSVSFTMTLWPNDDISVVELSNIVERGGIALGLGTYRGVYGKLVVDQWDVG